MNLFGEWDERTEKCLILKLSIDGFITFSSRNSKDIIDFEPEELIGTHLRQILYGEDYCKISGYWPLGREEGFSALLRLRDKAGDLLYCEAIFNHVRDSQEIKETIVIIKNGSNNKIIDSNLLDNEKLKVAGQLAAGVAHEIKNPLTSIKGFIQLMKTETIVNRKYLEVIEGEIKRLENISSELLVLAKPQHHEEDLHDLTVITKEVVFLMEAEALQKSIQCHFISDGQSYLLFCNRNKIKQVLINMVKNGIEAMEKPGIITISLSKQEDEVQIAITDEGCGIPEEYLDQLGKPFFSTKKKGNGLGLMVCQKIISEHNGSISIESKPNDGTTFIIKLPLVNDTAWKQN